MKCILFALPEQYFSQGLFGKTKKMKHPLFPPLGLLYIAAVLEDIGHTVEIIDLGVFNYSDMYIFDKVHNADFVGINVFTNNCIFANKLAKKLKDNFEDLLIVIGGPHCTFLKKKALIDIPNADIAVILEGENVIKEIIKYLEGKRILSDIPGIYYKEGKDIKKGGTIEIIKDLDSIPFPARHLVDSSKYGKFPWLNLSKYNFTSMMTSRGCPFKCRFCARYSNVFPQWGYRERSVENVVDEIIELNKKYKFVTIIDDNFLANNKRAHMIFDKLIEYDTDIIIQILGARIDCADRVLFKKMKKVNVKFISFGIESGNQEVLDFYNKNISLDQIRSTLKMTDEFGFITSATFIIGAPIETNLHIKNTINFICSLPLDHVKINILYYDMGSDLWIEGVKEGKISEDEFDVPSIISRRLSNFSINQLTRFQIDGYRKFYFHPKYFMRQLVKIFNDKDALRLKIVLNGFFLSFLV